MKKCTKLKNNLLRNICCSGAVVGILVFLFISFPFNFADGITLNVDNSTTTLEMVILNSGGSDITDGGSSVIDVRSSDAGTFGSTDVSVMVSTNNQTGYTLKMQAAEENLNRVLPLADGTTPFIAPLTDTAGGYTQEQIESNSDLNNTWGYKCTDCYKNNELANTNYLPTPIVATEIANTTVSGNFNTSVVTFGTKVDNSLPSGVYGTSIVFVATANYVPISNIEQLEYMQEFATIPEDELATVKENMVQDTQYILKDIRDEKEYYLAKLADGNIWMTQNLDFDLDSSVTLSSVNTDLNVAGSGIYSNGYSESDGVIYWTPINSTDSSINSSNGSFNDWASSSTQNPVRPASADPDAGSVSDWWYETGERFNSDLCANSGCNYLLSGNTVASTYFANSPFVSNGEHGKIGNYYNWPAAVASNSVVSIAKSSLENSICPKGWRLPSMSQNDNEFNGLNVSYNAGRTNTDEGLTSAPFYATRAGNVNDGGALKSSGFSGAYWSSATQNGLTSPVIYMKSNSVITDGTWFERSSTAFLVRCVAR